LLQRHVISISLSSLCVIIALIIFASLLMDNESKSKLNRFFRIFIIGSLGYMLGDIAGRLLAGNANRPMFILIRRIAMFVHYVSGPILLAALTFYIFTYIELKKTKVNNGLKAVTLVICGVAVLLTIVSQFNNMYYFIDRYNVYHRGEFMWLSQALPVSLMIMNIGVVIFYRKTFEKLSALFFMLYMALPVIATVIQFLFFGITYISIAITLIIVILYIRLQTEQMGMAEMERQRLSAENAALESLSRMKTEFMANLSHELKTPLTVVLGDIQRIGREARKQGLESERISESIDRAKDEIMRMARLTESAIKMAALQESHEKTAMLDPVSLFTAAAEGYRSIIEKQGNTLMINAEENSPHIYGNADQLIGVLSNLLTNSNNHTKNGEITINIEERGQFVSVAVKDSGTGIPTEILSRVFERGISGSDSTGMGLPICKSTVEYHGGTIRINSETGKGTEVVFTIPTYNGERLVEADV